GARRRRGRLRRHRQQRHRARRGGRGNAGRVAVRTHRPGPALAPLGCATRAPRRPGAALRRLPGARLPPAGPSLHRRGRSGRGGRCDRLARAGADRRRGGPTVVRLLLWHVHGSYTDALAQGGHDYHLPVVPDRGPDGRGRARTWDWPPNVREVTPAEARDLDLDAVILQRPEELAEACVAWT